MVSYFVFVNEFQLNRFSQLERFAQHNLNIILLTIYSCSLLSWSVMKIDSHETGNERERGRREREGKREREGGRRERERERKYSLTLLEVVVLT